MDTGFSEFHDRRAPQPPERHGWHLKKEVNLSIIISLVMVGFACIAGYFDLKRDIELLKSDTVMLRQIDARLEADSQRAIRDLQMHLERMEAKLDRLIERRP